MKTWDRGRKKATPEQKAESMRWQNERVRIANLIARKPEIQKICCICEKEGKILHNRKDPYYITFICDECRKDPNNLIIAEETRFDLRTKLNKFHLNTVGFFKKEVKELVEDYLNSQDTIGMYCLKNNISRHQFKQLQNIYNLEYPKRNIYSEIKSHSNNMKSKNAFPKVKIEELIEGYLNSKELIKEYCLNNNLCRYEFDRLLKIYNQIYPKRNIYNKVKRHSKKIKNIRAFSKEKVVALVEGYFKSQESIAEYCLINNINVNKFKKLQDRYNKRYPKRNIYSKIKSHSNEIRRKRISETLCKNFKKAS